MINHVEIETYFANGKDATTMPTLNVKVFQHMEFAMENKLTQDATLFPDLKQSASAWESQRPNEDQSD